MKKIISTYTAVIGGQEVQVKVYEPATKEDMDDKVWEDNKDDGEDYLKRPKYQPETDLVDDLTNDNHIWEDIDDEEDETPF